MPIEIVADYSATVFSKKASHALDAAAKGVVRVQRRGEVFMLMRAQQLEQIVREARDPRPKTLEDLVQDYDAPAIKAELGAWLSDPPQGKEVL